MGSEMCIRDSVKTEKHLSILHLNTRSLPGNFDKVTNLLSTLNLNFSMTFQDTIIFMSLGGAALEEVLACI